MTHGHLDHVGAIEPLIKVYPDLKVIYHETEAPFLLGTAQPSCYNYKPNGLSTGFKLAMLLKLLPPFVQYKVRIWLAMQGWPSRGGSQGNEHKFVGLWDILGGIRFPDVFQAAQEWKGHVLGIATGSE